VNLSKDPFPATSKSKDFFLFDARQEWRLAVVLAPPARFTGPTDLFFPRRLDTLRTHKSIHIDP
jgi:hypothetical protein